MHDKESINSQWDTTTLGEIVNHDRSSIQTGPFGTTLKAAEYTRKGVPLISVRELVDGRVEVDDKTPRVGQNTLDRLPQYILKPGDIVFGRKGSVERSALIRDKESGWFLGSDGIRIRLPRYVDVRFIHYQVKSRKTITWLLQHASGTTMPSMNQKILRNLPIILPPLPEQKAIASILGSLDDKIELNNQMNQTLETMARALYKSWFVDFDPVVAKAAGKRPYGMDDETAALFPDKFVDSELGPIPEGWRVIQLEEIADVNWGDTNVTKKSYVSEGYTAYSAKGPDGKLPYYDYSVDGIVLSAIGANCGLTWFAQDKWSCIKNTIRIIPKTEQINIEFIYYATDDPDAWPIRGSAQPFISQGDARQRKIIVPTDEIAKTFGNSVRNWHKLIYMNSKESQTLSHIRDILLPKLISGEIRIKDAEKVVEEAL
jgi:type I restriction enzyme, S subunit